MCIRDRLEAARTDGLCEEQQAVLRTALLKYGELFPVPVAVLAEPSTERSFGDLGVRLVGTAPLAVRRLDRAGAHPPLPTDDYSFPAIPRAVADRTGSDDFHAWLDRFADQAAGGDSELSNLLG